MIILAAGALMRADGQAVLAAAWNLAVKHNMLNADWHGFNILHNAAARVGALDIGFLPGEGGLTTQDMLSGKLDVLWLLGADEFDMSMIPENTFVIYQGHHGDAGAKRADLILPGAAYTEKDGTYVNTEGRVQYGFLATKPPGDAREDWRIIRAAAAYLGYNLSFETIGELRAQLAAQYPVFANTAFRRLAGAHVTAPAGDPAAVNSAPFLPILPNYYQTDPISRASPTMAACIAAHAPHLAEAAE
jgi:NADH-quinone oxidoreductase subunit G